VNWESLADDYLLQSKPLWEHYGLFPHGGMDTILGKGKKDISMLMTYVAVDRYLQRGGKLGFVLSQSLFKTSGAGQGFRRFLLPDKTPFGPVLVEDMVELNPFEGATNRTAVGIFTKGKAVQYPIAYSYWKKRGQGRGSAIGFDTPYEEVTKEKITYKQWYAEPIDAGDSTSAWITGGRKSLRALRGIIGQSHYVAHAGAFTGGANGVYGVEIVGARSAGAVVVSNIIEGAKRSVPNTQAAMEAELLYPLLRGRDVGRWTATPSAHILMTQDTKTRKGILPEVMKRDYPKAHSYLARFERILKSRAAYRRYFRETDAFWSMFNVSDFTFSDWKVVWREQSSRLTAAVIGPQSKRPVIPDHKLMMVAVETANEAHFLCATLNSAPAELAVSAYAVEIQMDTHILENIKVPKFSAKDKGHLRLAELSAEAHEFAGDAQKVAHIESEVDALAARLWQLTDDELAEIKRSLQEG